MGKLCNELENINHLISLVRDLEVGQFFISNVSGLDLSDDTETRSQWHYCDMMLLNGVSIQYAWIFSFVFTDVRLVVFDITIQKLSLSFSLTYIQQRLVLTVF